MFCGSKHHLRDYTIDLVILFWRHQAKPISQPRWSAWGVKVLVDKVVVVNVVLVAMLEVMMVV